MWTDYVCRNNSTKYEIVLGGVQAMENGKVCGGGAVVVATNLPPGQTQSGKVPPGAQCSPTVFVFTINYRHLPSGKTGTWQYPPKQAPAGQTYKIIRVGIKDPSRADVAEEAILEDDSECE